MNKYDVASINVSFHRLLTILDDLAESVKVNEGDRFITISSEVALLITKQSTASMHTSKLTILLQNYHIVFFIIIGMKS